MKWNRAYTRYVIDRTITLPDAILLRELNRRVTLHSHIHPECRNPKLSTSEYPPCPLPVPSLLTPTKNGAPYLPFVKHIRLFSRQIWSYLLNSFIQSPITKSQNTTICMWSESVDPPAPTQYYTEDQRSYVFANYPTPTDARIKEQRPNHLCRPSRVDHLPLLFFSIRTISATNKHPLLCGQKGWYRKSTCRWFKK